ncbi:hypothetical protein EC09BKT76207_1837 [Escherichia coli 09BKT076207]|nr:hypothetical protein ECFDA507_2346 [Escherichia coli FDA507]EKH51786.1 hypothetical protein ECNE037_2602 [Escherichia coli NE037]ERB78715.1 hypothetical protein EC09BKT76207_1837 [Escherichia coli 09BKT076207]
MNIGAICFDTQAREKMRLSNFWLRCGKFSDITHIALSFWFVVLTIM